MPHHPVTHEEACRTNHLPDCAGWTDCECFSRRHDHSDIYSLQKKLDLLTHAVLMLVHAGYGTMGKKLAQQTFKVEPQGDEWNGSLWLLRELVKDQLPEEYFDDHQKGDQ